MKRIIFFAAMLIVLNTACSKVVERTDIEENSQFVISATIPCADTRTTYIDETEDPTKGLKVEWEYDDRISVIEVDPANNNWLYGDVYDFSILVKQGAKATFKAPQNFVYDSGKKYLAIYPPMAEGDEEQPYYSTDYDNPTFALNPKMPNRLIADFIPKSTRIYQDFQGVNHLKKYDAMVSAVEFEDNKADIEFTKLNSVIKWELQLPSSAKGTKIYTIKIETDEKNVNLNLYGQLYFYDIFQQNSKQWNVSNAQKRFIMNLGNSNQTEYFTVPEDGKVVVYMPVLGSKYHYFKAGKNYTILLDSKYSVVASPPSDIKLEPGKIFVFKANMSKVE